MKRVMIMVWSLLLLVAIFLGTLFAIRYWCSTTEAVGVSTVRIFSTLGLILGIISGIVLDGIVFFCLIWFWWAPNNLCFTFVKEGTAEIVVKGGAFHKVLIRWSRRTLDENGNIVDGPDRRHPFGGMRFYGIWPIHSIYTYRFSWTGVKPDGTFEPHKPEVLDYALLKDDVYGLKVEGAEDHDKVPLDVDITLTVQIVNPYKAIFNIQNWFETLVNRLVPYVRDYITNHTYDWMIETDIRLDKEIVDKLAIEGIIGPYENPEQGGEFLLRYGVLVRRLEVRDINPQPVYREATLKAYRAQKEAEARSEENFGVLIQMLAKATNQKPEDVGQYLHDHPDQQEKFLQIAQDLLTRRIAIDGGAFVDIRVQGAEGMERGLLNLLALWKGMPGGKGIPGGLGGSRGASSEQAGTAITQPKKKRIEDMTKEEKRQAFGELKNRSPEFDKKG